MLLEQRAVIERLSCKLGKDTEDLELQFSAAVAKVMLGGDGKILLFVNERMVNVDDSVQCFNTVVGIYFATMS